MLEFYVLLSNRRIQILFQNRYLGLSMSHSTIEAAMGHDTATLFLRHEYGVLWVISCLVFVQNIYFRILFKTFLTSHQSITLSDAWFGMTVCMTV